MRRAILAVALGGVLMTGAACDSTGDADTTAASAPSAAAIPSSEPASPAPDYSANTKLICGRVQKIFAKDLAGFGTQVGKMIAYKEAKQTADAKQAQKAAGAELKDVGAKVRKETAAAQDPQLRQAGATSAAKFVKTAGDATFFDKIKTTKDLDRVIERQMTEWFTPVAGFCA
jgi:hypothetical protein